MSQKLSLPLFSALLLLNACGNSQPANSDRKGDTAVVGKPVETQSPNTDYQPAFAGQTRAPGARTATAYEAVVVARDLDRPWGIAALPDGRLLVTEKKGSLRIVTTDGKVSEKITGIPKVDAAGQGGLLDVTLDPAFADNRMIYWSFSEKSGNGNLTAVATGRLADDERSVQNAVVIYRAVPAYDGDKHYGSRLVFDRDGYLFVSTGERSDKETRPQAQQLNSALGKILRITTDGKPAPGNPLAGNTAARPEIYTYGHRNVQGLALHPETGELWETEMGPRGGDELNRIEAGKDYGWPAIGYGIEYNGDKVGEGITQKEGMEQPVYYWDPVLSPSGMTFYNGDAIPEWKNNVFIAGLNSKHISRLILQNNRVYGEERLLANEGQRFRDVAQGNDGALYAITDEGRLYRIGKK